MSRENFFVRVNTVATDKTKESVVLLHCDHIVSIVPSEKSTQVLTVTGLVYTIKEVPEFILKQLEKYNVGRELT